MAYRHDGFFHAMDTLPRVRGAQRDLGPGRGPVEGLGRGRRPSWAPSGGIGRRSSPAPPASSAAGSCARLLEAGADVVCLVRDWVPQQRARALGPRSTASRSSAATSATRRCSSGPSASTRSTPSSTSPRRRSSASPTATRSRPSRRTSRAPGRCSRPAAARPLVRQIVVASSDKAYGDQERAALRRDDAAPGPPPLRRQQVVRRPDRADVRRRPTACRWRSPAAATSTAAAT